MWVSRATPSYLPRGSQPFQKLVGWKASWMICKVLAVDFLRVEYELK
jgi:hypothetical protein